MSNETQEIKTEAIVVVEKVSETATTTATTTTATTPTVTAADNDERDFLSPDAHNEKAGFSLDGRSDIDFTVVDALPSDLGKDDEVDDEKKKKKKGKDEEEPAPTVSFMQLYRFASWFDKLLLLLGTIGAAVNGAGLPLMTIIFSEILNALSSFTAAHLSKDEGRIKGAADDLNDTVRKYVIYFVGLGCLVFVVAYAQMTFWMIAGENISGIVRQRYYEALMRQNIGFFDEVTTGDVTTRIAADTAMFQEGISEKVGLALQFGVTFLTGFIIGFVRGWKLALVVCSVIPLLVVGAVAMGKSMQASTVKGQDAYAKAGSVAEQMISGIRTVVAFGGEQRAVNRYVAELDYAFKSGKRKAFISGIGLGSIFFVMFSTYGLGFWYGSRLLLDGSYNVADVLNTFFALIIGAFSLGQVAPNFSAITNAMGAAAKLYAVIDRKPPIDSQSDDGLKLQKGAVKGRIEFQSVNFYYPSRPDVPVLKNFSLVIEPGETVALVGSSGSGKSTIVALLERYYDPSGGTILLDGQDIREISVKSLRSQMGMVGQEPVLFQTSIEQNIKWGGIPGEKDPTMDEIIEVCKKANAHEFIQEQPQKYETTVGEKGSLLSGGQKQRIAIARALVKDPAILLLDEATSALDTTSERLVQEALDKAATDRTTVVIAHRLSTIKDADKIVVMSKGEIVEVGRHDELIEKRGVYHGLVRAQELKTEKRPKSDDDEESSGSSTEGDQTVVNIDEKQNRQQMLRRTSTKGTVKSTKTDEEIRAEDEAEKMKVKTPLRRVARLNFPERWIILAGAIGGILQGAQMPLYAVIFTRIFDVFAKAKTDRDEFTREANFWSAMFIVLAGVCLIGMSLQVSMFTWSGERLTRRIRVMTFEAIVRQDIAFFDEERNGTGVLTSRLAVDASKVEGLTGSLMGTIVQVATTLIFGLTLAFAHGWRLTLVIVASMPIAGMASMFQLKTLAGFSARTRSAYEGSGQIVQQSVSNMRTIAALTREGTFITMYSDTLKQPHRVAVRGFLLSSFGYAISQGVLYFIWSLAFWYGTKLVVDGEYTVLQMMSVIFAVIFSAVALGQTSNFAPNTAKAKVAAVSIFELLDRKPAIDVSETKDKVKPAPVTGEMRIEDAKFNYPARPDIEVLRGFNMEVPSGKTVALVGGSGCGKSTIIGLLLRFYDMSSGTIEIERTAVPEWNLEYMRSFFAVVGQEPMLFNGTIGENIAFGKEGCSQEEIDTAAKNANIHNFISNLPKGYDTPVGEKGAQLSGGQKQRVAIARALIRAPKILLLDEATSALDSESEKVVQDALDRASKGRTTVTIAHRLSTIQNADLIYVVKKGAVVESGKHHDLIKLGGVYADLVKKQQLGLVDA